MAEIKIEPGPWEQWNSHVSGRRKAVTTTTIKAADRKTICTLAAGTDEWVNAHGRVLKAAPEMYAVLSRVAKLIERDAECRDSTCDCHATAAEIRRVLAKVRGEVGRG